jgi:hypothetical protein
VHSGLVIHGADYGGDLAAIWHRHFDYKREASAEFVAWETAAAICGSDTFSLVGPGGTKAEAMPPVNDRLMAAAPMKDRMRTGLARGYSAVKFLIGLVFSYVGCHETSVETSQGALNRKATG